MKYKLVMDIEINSVEDLKKLRTIVEANNLDKLNYSEIARNLGIDRRTAKKYYLGDDKKERKKKKSVIDEHYNIIEELLSEDSTINCKYRIVFAPKYRRQIIYGKIRQDVGRILR